MTQNVTLKLQGVIKIILKLMFNLQMRDTLPLRTVELWRHETISCCGLQTNAMWALLKIEEHFFYLFFLQFREGI